MAGDIYYNSVSLLLHGDGTNGSTTFTDNSPTPKTVTIAAGSPVISTTQSKYGGASISFPSYNDRITVPASADMLMVPGTPFTIEGWFRPISTTAYGAFFTPSVGSFNLGVSINNVWFRAGGDTGVVATVPSTAFTHVAFVYTGTEKVMFVSGIEISRVAITFPTLSQTATIIGGASVDSNGFYGYIDDLRVTNGIARYTSNFTPPTGAFLNYVGLLTGTITESLGITKWLVTATNTTDGSLAGVQIGAEAATTYSINCNTLAPCNIQLSAFISYAWSVGKVTTLNDYVCAVNPDTTPHLWKCTTAGTTHATTEPTWNLSGTTTDNTTTWTYVAPLPDRPLSLGPKIPA